MQAPNSDRSALKSIAAAVSPIRASRYPVEPAAVSTTVDGGQTSSRSAGVRIHEESVS